MRSFLILMTICVICSCLAKGETPFPTTRQVEALFEQSSNDMRRLSKTLPPLINSLQALRYQTDSKLVCIVDLDLAQRVLAISVPTNAPQGFNQALTEARQMAYLVIGSAGDKRFHPEYAMMIANNLGRYSKFATNDLMTVIRAAQQSDIDNHRVMNSPFCRYPSVRPAVANYRRLVRFNQDIGYYRRGFAEWFAESVNDYRNTLPPAAAVSFTNDFIRAAKLTPEEIKVWFPPQGTNDFLNAGE